MPLADFIHLRVHSAYSLSAGAIKIKELVQLCRSEAMPAVAITDTGNLFGALEFATAGAEAGIQPIIGCEIALAPNGGARNGRAPNGHMAEPDRIVLLVQSEAGYRNLMALVSRAYLDGEAGAEPAVALADLAAANDGLLCLAGGAAGPVGRLLAEGQTEAAEAALAALKEIFPGRLYIELQRHGLPEELRCEAGLIDHAFAHDLPLLATNDAHFPDRDFYEAHDALLCIAQGRAVADDDRKHLTPEHFVRPAPEMRALFADLPEACDNTLVIARRCAFIPQPQRPILPAFPLPDGADEATALRIAARAGLDARLEAAPVSDEKPYHERLEFELDMIVKTGFAGYFLIVADFIQWAKRQGIPVGPGRGSGAGSVVAWALTITDLDPLRFGLLFERFLNPERVSMPDFDIDFCQDRRDEVIRYVQQKYGRDRVTQFNMKWVELAGLVKFDFLGLKTLTVLARCLELLEARGVALDLANLPLDDRASYELLARGDTVGVFQVEGAGVRDMLKKLRPDRFEDIIAVVSLYRPGPMENIPRYIAVKHGEEAPDYLHPALEEILKETHGIMIYQEQVMQIAQVLAGYTLGGADLLRRAMGKKIQSEMNAQRKLFVEGAAARGVGRARAELIFDQMAKFDGYGFNKSHAAAYALVAYQTAYLKANHPVEFMAASMTLDLGNTDKLNHFRQELGRLGIALLPPDINCSDVAFAVETDAKTGNPAIRYALAAVKGVGEQAMRELVGERAAHGPYKDLFDFARRLDTKSFNRRQFENLVKAGAFECLNPNRAQSFSAAELLLRQASRAAEERVTKQENLFAAVDSGFAARPSLPVVADWPSVERLQNEFEAIGFYLSSHPLDPYAKSLERAGVLRWVDLPAALAANGSSRFRLGGIVIGKKERTSARGNRFAFVQLSDTSGAFEVTMFSETLAQARGLLEGGQPLIVTVDVRREDESLRLTVE